MVVVTRFTRFWTRNPIQRMMTISAEQCRAARAWLGWTQARLATEAGVALSLVQYFERGERLPIRNNILAISRAFETAGIAFLFGNDGAPAGLKLSSANQILSGMKFTSYEEIKKLFKNKSMTFLPPVGTKGFTDFSKSKLNVGAKSSRVDLSNSKTKPAKRKRPK
jgi:transcriptional regulator with XRE-family HTH domain